MKYEIKDHLIKRGYKEISKGLFSKNCKTIKLISNESILDVVFSFIASVLLGLLTLYSLLLLYGEDGVGDESENGEYLLLFFSSGDVGLEILGDVETLRSFIVT